MANSSFKTLQDNGFSELVDLVKRAGLEGVLSGSDEYTILAPTDAAFNELDQSTLSRLSKDKKRLVNLLKYHVLAGIYKEEDLDTIDRATTLEGEDVVFEHDDDTLRVDEALVAKKDINADNGVIHSLSAVMLPEKYLY